LVAVGVTLFFAGYTLLDWGYIKVKGYPGIGLYDLVLPQRREKVYAVLAAGAPGSGSKAGTTSPPPGTGILQKGVAGSGGVIKAAETPFRWLGDLWSKV
jgi:hypothetical protein